jgi:hypothetical protein
LREQDGSPERELKNQLIELFRREEGIEAAYLAQVAYTDDGENAVSLCLRADRPNHEVMAEIGQVFSSMFAAHEHLDILFLDDGQEAELTKCCAPFWPSR